MNDQNDTTTPEREERPAAQALPDPAGPRIGKIGSLLHALECIAGKSHWIDNTMSDKQLAKYVLCRLYYEKEEAQAMSPLDASLRLAKTKNLNRISSGLTRVE